MASAPAPLAEAGARDARKSALWRRLAESGKAISAGRPSPATVAPLVLLLAWNIWLIGSSTSDLPYADDYGVLLGFLSDVKERGFSWTLLWDQQSEHRPVFGRAVTLAVSAALGRLDFAALTAVANLGWAACLALLAGVAFRASRGNAWVVLAVAALLVTPTHYENAIWGISGLAFYGLSAFSLVCLERVARGDVWRGAFALVAAVLTSAGGFLLLPVICCDLALKKEWRRASLFAGLGLGLAVVYFWRHQPVDLPASAPHRSLPTMLAYGLSFVGSAFPGPRVALGAGGLLAAGLLVVAGRRRQDDTFLSMVAAFLLLTAAAAAFSRSSMGVEQALDSRYSVFSLIGLVCVLLAFVSSPAARRLAWAPSAAAAAGLALASLLTWSVFSADHWRLEQVRRLTDFYLVINQTRWNGHLMPYLERAQRLGVYDGRVAAAAAPRLPPDRYRETRPALLPARGYVDAFEGDYLVGWAHLPAADSSRATLRVLLEGSAGSYTVPVWRYRRPDVEAAFPDGGHHLDSGFQVVLSDFALPAGSYRVGILVSEGASRGVLALEQVYLARGPAMLLPAPGPKALGAGPPGQ